MLQKSYGNDTGKDCKLLTWICQDSPLWTADNSAQVWRTLFSHAGTKAWNSLYHAIQEITNSNIFKRKLKTFLFEPRSLGLHCDSFLPLVTLGVSTGQLELNWTELAVILMPGVESVRNINKSIICHKDRNWNALPLWFRSRVCWPATSTTTLLISAAQNVN